ncbi:hypothetical protein SXCC_04494 [Gluconacetobacter sp. SXCC-1]|nr:hypothetical protein SXCC_04494 [Gluconacetobacter sp. SXCC-1]
MTITHSPQTGEFSTSTFGEITTSTHSGTASDLGAIVPTGWRDMQGLQVAWLCAIPLAPQSMSKRLKRDHAMPRFTGRLGELDVIVGQDV